MRETDAGQSPSFEKDWQAAHSGLDRTRPQLRFRSALVFAALSLLLAIGALIAYRLVHSHGGPDAATNTAEAKSENPGSVKHPGNTHPVPSVAEVPTSPALQNQNQHGRNLLPFLKAPKTSRPRFAYNGHRPPGDRGNRPLPSDKLVAKIRATSQGEYLISNWRSPTDFLLRIADDRLLNSVPKLDDSIVRIDSSPLDAR
ncbi:MAG: hypothetical protein ACREDR_03975 [Blastocatellia bacterium]